MSTSSLVMERERSLLLTIDVQERLCPVMDDPRRVLANGARLARAARRLSVPILVTEQYPKGLGPTMHDIRVEVPPEVVVEKLSFSSAAEPSVMARLEETGRSQAVINGIEMHVCVLQTALGLKQRGWDVFVVADACSSRQTGSEAAALARMTSAGIAVVTTEMVLFEWLGTKEDEAFKDIMAMIR